MAVVDLCGTEHWFVGPPKCTPALQMSPVIENLNYEVYASALWFYWPFANPASLLEHEDSYETVVFVYFLHFMYATLLGHFAIHAAYQDCFCQILSTSGHQCTVWAPIA